MVDLMDGATNSYCLALSAAGPNTGDLHYLPMHLSFGFSDWDYHFITSDTGELAWLPASPI